MKAKSIIVAGLVALFSTAFFTSNAQTNPTIKVLPGAKDGIVKLLVVGIEDESVNVKFFNDEGLIESDAIKASEGFNKKYDVRKFASRGIMMEINTEGTSVTYKIAKNGSKMTPFLVKESYTYPLVASK